MWEVKVEKEVLKKAEKLPPANGKKLLEFTARSKKYTLYTDAAQHIYNLLRQYTNA